MTDLKITMANQEQLALLKNSVEEWNEWRRNNPDVIIDLMDANLVNVNLMDANLINANLVSH
jgi:uncharacterized protein YjbI with pentapeptide repeats